MAQVALKKTKEPQGSDLPGSLRLVRPRIMAVIPAYNEARNLPSLVPELRSLKLEGCDFDFVIVNDGSQDDTAKVARGLGAKLVSLPLNMGIGVTVQTGFIYALEQGFHWVVQVDGDCQHIPEEIKKLIPPVLEGRADVVIGSRYAENEAQGIKSTTPLRWLAAKLLAVTVRRVTGTTITDPTSGFRLFNREAAGFVAEHYPDDYPEVEVLALLSKSGYRLTEVPVLMRPRKNGQSSINWRRAVYYMIKVIMATVMSSFRAKLGRDRIRKKTDG